MKIAVSANDRTYSLQVPWWFLLAALLCGVLWQPASAWASNRFTDVPSSHLFHDDIEWMAESKVTAGCGNDQFCPDDFVTRGQMAAFMRRFASNVATGSGTDPEVESRLASLESEVSSLQSKVADLESTDGALQGEVDALQNLLAGVTRSGNTLRLTGMNLQVVDGSGETYGATNGLGNVIIGYDAARSSGSDKSGSHYLVVGDEHNYTAFGGIVVGLRHTASSDWASVSGGSRNTASGYAAAVSGGDGNTASGSYTSVFGGFGNDATINTASVHGGAINTASGSYASVAGGYDNTASGSFSSILGGQSRTVSTNYACHPSCA